MSMPVIERPENPIDREQSINDIIESVALIETGLSHIVNAEGEKIQKVVNAQTEPSIDDMIRVNDSVSKMVSNVSKLEMILQSKLELTNELSNSSRPTTESAYMYAASIDTITPGITVLPDEHKMLGFTANAANTEFTAQVAGTYLISYRDSTGDLETLATYVTVNGTRIVASDLSGTTNAGNTTETMFIQDLAVGDVISLNIEEPNPVTYIEGVAAYLCIVKIA